MTPSICLINLKLNRFKDIQVKYKMGLQQVFSTKSQTSLSLAETWWAAADSVDSFLLISDGNEDGHICLLIQFISSSKKNSCYSSFLF